ncbi:hypothetical protein [Azospirillum endophyticum]
MTAVEAIDNLVLGTVNAPFKRSLDAETLAESVKSADVDTWLSHVVVFFIEVKAHLVIAFAKAHGITIAELQVTYAKIKALTGEINRALDAELSGLANAA